MTSRITRPQKRMGPKPLPLIEKLFRQSALDLVTDCMIWTGPVDKDGYGKVPVGRHGYLRAHVAAWMVEYGASPVKPLQVQHHCDVRRCWEIAHLYEGTQKQNMADRLSRGRWRGGRPRKCPDGSYVNGRYRECPDCQRRRRKQ